MSTTRNGWLYYVLTLVVELIPAISRWALASLLVLIVSKIPVIIALISTFGHHSWLRALDNPDLLRQSYYIWQFGQIIVWAFVLYPFVLSGSALLLRQVGFLANRLAIGARAPSGRELTRIEEAFDNVLAASPVALEKPSHIYVIDHSQLASSSLGTTLYLTRELVNSSYLEPVLARELGHLQSGDARLQLALRSLAISWLHLIPVVGLDFASSAVSHGLRGHGLVGAGIAGVTAFNWLALLSRGGLGVLLLRPLWAQYWQRREYEADQFAADCGQAPGLVEYLEKYESFDIAVPYYIADKPYTEQRIERLLTRIQNPSPPVPSQALAKKVSTPANPSRTGRGMVIGGIALALVVGGWLAFGVQGASSQTPVDGNWHLISFCLVANCTPTGGPPFEYTVILSFNPPDTSGNKMQMISTNPAGEVAQFEGTFTHLGDNLHVQGDADPTLPINVFPEYQFHLDGDTLLMRTPRAAYLWRREIVYYNQLTQFVRHWKHDLSGDTYIIGRNAIIFRNEEYIGAFTILDDSHLVFDNAITNKSELYQYVVTNERLTLSSDFSGSLLIGTYKCIEMCN